MVIGLTRWLYFFVRAAIYLTISLGGAVSLAINRTISIKTDVTIRFSEIIFVIDDDKFLKVIDY